MDLPQAELTVRSVLPAELPESRMWIDNWQRMLPYIGVGNLRRLRQSVPCPQGEAFSPMCVVFKLLFYPLSRSFYSSAFCASTAFSASSDRIAVPTSAV